MHHAGQMHFDCALRICGNHYFLSPSSSLSSKDLQRWFLDNRQTFVLPNLLTLGSTQQGNA
tara:strand:- start:11 stop:193 length:183 start_codon:yes stop_codon:yes gene_type:complete